MGIKLDDFVVESTKKLSDIMASPAYDQREKQLIVDAVSNELIVHINDSGNLDNVDYLIQKTSMLYFDAEISSILQKKISNNEIYNKAILHAKRLQTIQKQFTERKWPNQSIQQTDIEEVIAEINKQRRAFLISDQIKELDSKLTVLLSQASINLLIEDCNNAENCLKQLQETIVIADSEEIIYGDISNKNYKQCAASIEKIKAIATKKSETDMQMVDIDNRIQDAELRGDADEKYWAEAIKLSKKQDSFISDYLARKWKLPKLKRQNMATVREQFQTYQEMDKTDRAIRMKADSVSTEEQYAELEKLSDQQMQNISICYSNTWRIPGKIITDFSELLAAGRARVDEEMRARKRVIRRIKMLAVTLAIIVMCILAVAVTYFKSTEGKKKSPFDNLESIGTRYEVVEEGFKKAGFKNIIIEEDTSGWSADGIVTDVVIGNSHTFTKGVHYDEAAKIIIKYSSQGRIDIQPFLANWKNTDRNAIVRSLQGAGFTKISLIERGTTNKEIDGKNANLMINGQEYHSGKCYIPSNAPIQLEYYVYKIIIGNNAEGFAGKDYKTIVETLQAKGFKNVQKEIVYSGWQKGNSVVSVTVQGSKSYKSTDMFNRDARIVVSYSSDDRVEVTEQVSKWKTVTFDSLQDELRKIDFINVKSTFIPTKDLKKHHKIDSITINDALYEKGDCYIRKRGSITINYYRAMRSIGRSKDKIRELGDYTKVKAYFSNCGFTNIVLKRSDDLNVFTEWGGWIAGRPDKGVSKIIINGKDNFKDTDEIYIDSEIILLVNTYSGRYYDGM